MEDSPKPTGQQAGGYHTELQPDMQVYRMGLNPSQHGVRITVEAMELLRHVMESSGEGRSLALAAGL
ncbi:hypothetical protein [Acidihalobacter ferrooxydans]|nr:hypothetical protein [Acidihalobacter ferrooxydans]